MNENIPREQCTVHYPDFNLAVQMCIKEGVNCKIGHSDMRSAFRQLGTRKSVVLDDNEGQVSTRWSHVFLCRQMCGFGSSKSYAIFQEFSNCIVYLVKFRTKKNLLNYLDDYYFCAMMTK